MTSRTPSCVIVVDGGVDLPPGFARHYGLRMIPLMLSFGQGMLRSGMDIEAPEFYSRLRAHKEQPSTSMPSVGDYVALYKEAAEAGLPVLSMHLSSGLSGSYNSAHIAREMLPDLEIHLVDCGTLSAAMGMQVLVAAEMAREGAPVEAILAATRRVHESTSIFYTLDTLEYLKRGGRIGRVAGFVGTLLGLRPIITVDKATGTYVGAGKARSFRLAASSIVEQVVADAGEGSSISLVVLHGDCEAEAVRLLEALRKRLKVEWVHTIRINPSLGVHVGPDTVGVCYYKGVLPVSEPEVAIAL
jgi:DegV family protein with EDD domain